MALRQNLLSKPMETDISEDGQKKSTSLIAEQFLLEYELLQLLEQLDFTPSIVAINQVNVPIGEFTNLTIDNDLTLKITNLKQAIMNIQYLMKSNILLNLDDANFVREQLTKRCNLMLKIACIQKNAVLRDVAIKVGAQHEFLLKDSMNLLLESYKDPKRLTPIDEYDSINYDKTVFLLDSKLPINILDILGIAQEMGPIMLIPIFNYLKHQERGLSNIQIRTYLKDHLLRYMKDYTINILLERSNIPQMAEICMSILNCTEIEFVSAVGDEERLKDILISMNLKDASIHQALGSQALIKACAYGQKNTAKILIDAGADVNTTLTAPGVILHKAIKGKHVDIVELLLASREIEINLKPFANAPNIYDYAMRSSSFEIKKLFEAKKIEIDKQINEFTGKIIAKIRILHEQAAKLFAGIGCTDKAKSLQQALNNAIMAQPTCFSVYQFLHIKVQDEPSIFEALEKIRIWSKPENDDLLKDITVPLSYMRLH